MKVANFRPEESRSLIMAAFGIDEVVDKANQEITWIELSKFKRPYVT